MLEKLKKIARAEPNKIAIYQNNQTMSYSVLVTEIEKCMDELKKLKIEKDVVVPIYMNVDFNLIITIFSIVSLEAIYVPISTKEPTEKISYILEALKTNFIITNSHDKKLSGFITISIDDFCYDKSKDLKIQKIENEDLVYIMFTSGSTGDPKGVKITKSNLEYILNIAQLEYPIGEKEKYILSTPYAFDVSVIEIFGWISGKGSLVLYDLNKAANLKNLTNQVITNRVSHLALSPSTLELLLNFTDQEEINRLNFTLKYLMVAGEEFKASLAKKSLKLLPDVKVINLYGPTETTVYATQYLLNKDFSEDYVPIGRALKDVKIKIVDSGDNETTEIGEILIGGKGVAKGYLLKDLEKNIFINFDGNLYYRTGDYGQFLEDGNIKFYGRKDDQIQINGVRIELKSIENAIEKYSSNIISSKLLYKNNKLYCFYTSIAEIDVNDIKNYLRKKIVEISIPHFFIQLEKFPLNKSNKVDKKKLEEFIISLKSKKGNLNNNNNNYNTSSTEMKSLKALMNSLFEIENCSSKNTFNYLGLDSLDHMTLIMTIEKEFNIQLPDWFLFQNNTLEKIEKYLMNEGNNNLTNKINDNIKYDVIEDIQGFFNENNQLLNNSSVFKKYDTYYLQKLYVYDDFLSYIDIVIDLPGHFPLNEVKKAIYSFIKNNEMFRINLIKENNKLWFCEHEYNVSNLKIPVLKNSVSLSNEECIKTIHKKNTEALRTNNLGLQFVFTILDTQEGFKIVLTMSHNIADGSNEHIIKEELHALLNGLEPKEKSSYAEFIKFIKENNNINKVLKDDNTNELKKVSKEVTYDKSLYKNSDALILKTTINEKLKNNELVNLVNFLSIKLLCESTKNDKLIFSTIMNIRDYKGNKNFKQSVGDYHSSFTFVGYENEDFITFNKRLNNLIEEYKKGYNPIFSIFENYPIMTNIQKELEEIYDLQPYVKTNFTGSYKREDLEFLLKSQEKIKKQLSSFPVDTIYVNSFAVENELYIVFLTSPFIDTRILEERNLEKVNLESLPSYGE